MTSGGGWTARTTKTSSKSFVPGASTKRLLCVVLAAAFVATVATGCIGQGTHVGIGPNLGAGQTPAGLWRTVGGEGCYWARLSGFSGNTSDIIANEFSFSGPRYAQILPTDAGFETSGCFPFWQVAPVNPTGGPFMAVPGQPFNEGDYLVNAEVAPGTYSSPGGSGCYWARLSNFSGKDNIIANEFSFSGAQAVTISPTDYGFTSSDCGTWTKIR